MTCCVSLTQQCSVYEEQPVLIFVLTILLSALKIAFDIQLFIASGWESPGETPNKI